MPDAGAPLDAGDTARGAGGTVGAGRIRRVAPLAGLTTRAVGGAAVMALRSRLTGESSAEFHLRTAERYAELLGDSKGALMKVGQILSFAALGSAVPREFQSIYQTAFAGLRSEAPPMAPELARTVLEAELGDRMERAFVEFDLEPFAAASIGQVHAARLHDGRAVAVKIQYPGVADAIRADLKNAELLATLMTLAVGGLFPRGLKLDLRGVAGEIGRAHRRGARLQARGGQPGRVRRVLPRAPVHPRPRRDRGAVYRPRADTGARAWTVLEWRPRRGPRPARPVGGGHPPLCLSLLLPAGPVQRGPDPGNYVFHEDGKRSFLDFGSVKRLRRDRIEMLVAIYREGLRGDVQGTWRASVEAGMWRSTDPVTPEEVFAYWREDNPLVWAQRRFVADPDCVGKGLQRRFSPTGPSANALRYCTMPPDYALLARAEIGAMSVIAQLRAGNNWRSLASEYCEGAPPLTAMGKRELAFLQERERQGA